MKFIHNKECIWNPVSDCLGCPYQSTCEATLTDIARAMWEENQRMKNSLNKIALSLGECAEIVHEGLSGKKFTKVI